MDNNNDGGYYPECHVDDNPLDSTFSSLCSVSLGLKKLRSIDMKELADELKLDNTMIPMVQGNVVLIGDSKAGKTSLLQSLNRSTLGRFTAKLTRKNRIKDHDRTVGVDVRELKMRKIGKESHGEVPEENIFITCFDFAGQEDYYAAHQLFLSEGALFIIVFDLSLHNISITTNISSTTLPSRIEFWMRSVQVW